MYWKSTQNISEIYTFGSNHSKKVEFLCSTLEKFRNFVDKNLEKFRSCTRKRHQEYAFDPKHSKSVWFRPKKFTSIWFFFKTFEKYRHSTQIILKVSYLYIIHSKTSNLYPKLPKISNSSSIHLKSIEFQFKRFVKYCDCKQKFERLFVNKRFEKDVMPAPKHLNSIWFCPTH